MPTSGLRPDVVDMPIWQGDIALVVVETPRGSANKLKYDTGLGAFRLDRVLPAGMSFPFDFGFIPQTLADDGDPLDVIVLLDAPVYPGCIVPARVIGDLEAEQRDGRGPWERNDRLLAVPRGLEDPCRGANDRRRRSRCLLDAIGAFFVDYHRLDGEAFRVVGPNGCPRRAAGGPARRTGGTCSKGDERRALRRDEQLMATVLTPPARVRMRTDRSSRYHAGPAPPTEAFKTVARDIEREGRRLRDGADVDEIHDLRVATRLCPDGCGDLRRRRRRRRT